MRTEPIPAGDQIPVPLQGRAREQAVLNRLLREVREGRSRALVLRGEAGVGKTALLAHLASHHEAGRVVCTVGVETESEIPYANLHHLCAPLLDHLEQLSPTNQQALTTALGLAHGDNPGHLQIGLAVLDLFAEAAAEAPLVCVVDDVQWVDGMSAAILAFVARRLDAEAVALVFAVNTTASALAPANARLLAGLPELSVEGLDDEDARALLTSATAGPVDPTVLDWIVAESHGNPLALLELSRNHRQ
ncbi:MAG: ATP-binding protein [Catenulispora sp.]|nr:ATP-binding protein [Catenulispora sp.]